LKRCNDDLSIDALSVLGKVIQQFMDQDPSEEDPTILEGQTRIKKKFTENQLNYHTNGLVTHTGASPATETLVAYFRSGDFTSVEAEFQRAVSQIDRDPHAAITASSSIIEALCKVYIETFTLEMPAKQTVVPLWKAVQQHLGLNIDSTLQEDQKKILQGLASIVDGIGAYRTHIGSAHGRGIRPPKIQVYEARLAVSASHALVVFICDRWKARRIANSS
jgi:hypothetical protein